ncbi:MAG: hypothetical protein KKA45_10605, partial [Alphaproteobacteria bacterium]|nr:hypothetical protein [Alphaproteobacteria bacterium]
APVLAGGLQLRCTSTALACRQSVFNYKLPMRKWRNGAMWGWRLTTILASFILAAPTWAAAPPSTEEHLVVAPYPGGAPWQVIADKRNADQIMIERIPADQSARKFKDIIIEQTFFRLQGQDPEKFLDGLLRRLSSGCRSARVNGPKADIQNGFPVAYGQSYCIGVRGEDVDSFIKVIGGNSALYVIQREMHRPTTRGAAAGVRTFSADELDQLRALISAQKIAAEYTATGVQLCPAAEGDAACPQDVGAVPAS